MLLLPLTRFRLGSSLDVSDADFALAAVVLVLSVRPPHRAGRTSAWHLGGLLIVVGGILASIDAVSTSSSLKVVGDGVFVLFVWQWTTRQVLDTERRTQGAMSAVVAGATLSGLVAIAQSLHHHAAATAGASSERAMGLTQQPNIAAVTLALGLLFAIGLALDRGRGRLSHRIVSIVVIGVALMFTGSVSRHGRRAARNIRVAHPTRIADPKPGGGFRCHLRGLCRGNSPRSPLRLHQPEPVRQDPRHHGEQYRIQHGEPTYAHARQRVEWHPKQPGYRTRSRCPVECGLLRPRPRRELPDAQFRPACVVRGRHSGPVRSGARHRLGPAADGATGAPPHRGRLVVRVHRRSRLRHAVAGAVRPMVLGALRPCDDAAWRTSAEARLSCLS